MAEFYSVKAPNFLYVLYIFIWSKTDCKIFYVKLGGFPIKVETEISLLISYSFAIFTV